MTLGLSPSKLSLIMNSTAADILESLSNLMGVAHRYGILPFQGGL
jgi:hypothetical protein